MFIGLENINPANLKEASKGQNQITEYRAMMQAWRKYKVLTFAGYILGFPHDTPESVANDIAVIQRELPIDMLEFFILTPLPGSRDHQQLAKLGTPMDSDMNKYDSEHVVTAHRAHERRAVGRGLQRRAWTRYYSPAHIETMIKRATTSGAQPAARRRGDLLLPAPPPCTKACIRSRAASSAARVAASGAAGCRARACSASPCAACAMW